jgi:predicted ABC-type transport system involved in lysophospholipase L1 biosynthesis ATPase subunit
MNSTHPGLEAWAEWWRQLDALRAALKRNPSLFIRVASLREQIRAIVQSYFRVVRPQLIDLEIPPTMVEQLDDINQSILSLSAKVNRTTSYTSRLNSLDDLRTDVSIAAEIRSASRGMAEATRLPTAAEASILATLEQIVPSTALSYKQVLLDLGDKQRISFRGTAAELREVLRELLDHLAPDEDVLKTVTLEKDQKQPTMKQKAAFILKARGIGDTARKAPVDAVGIVEESVGSLARSVYTRGSLSTHVVTTRQEVLTIKAYTDAVLFDLLQIHR